MCVKYWSLQDGSIKEERISYTILQVLNSELVLYLLNNLQKFVSC